jgi:hypothetical protein
MFTTTLEHSMAATRHFVSHDRQGFFQLGSYNYATSNLNIHEDTNPESKTGYHGLRGSEEVEKLISIIVSFGRNRVAHRDELGSHEQAKLVYDMMTRKSNGASYGGHGFGSLVERTFKPSGMPRDYIPYKVTRETAS